MNFTPTQLNDWIQFFQKEIPNHVTDTRWQHILRVASYAKELALVHGYEDPNKAYLAGLCHDITKQKKMDVHQSLFAEFNLETDGIPFQALHAYSAPLFLKKNYDFYDQEIQSAIQNHTLGNPKPTLLDQILYAADFLGSDYCYRNLKLEEWIQKTKENLDFGIFMKAFQTISFLMEKKEIIHPHTFLTYNQSLLSLKEI
ncbi:metal dependent phosphohydrolase [Leptospira ellinghausenii]|uniref:bis(5'-nucleosyl)-tetraphosphatase (symmetrical) n=1 Tax=Leptospira ellinghausenii TaxID=1917822 RepID=A0A2P2DBN2_9LEPT|nr:bis(5'-nucleosyl)-tetraphosphatase (symmetrical) YqeK [Leptospira ellinghausenii]GBF42033.1 metal dependent phosphohydrolase [Leptospira ellinghausenii]